MSAKKESIETNIVALRVHQWMKSWDKVNFDNKQAQGKPDSKHFLLFSIRASHLKALTGVYRRSTKGGTARMLDPNVQRGHEEVRSQTIRKFVEFGFPWCEMTESQKKQPGAEDLRKPGWLPTAILVNILEPNEARNGVRIANEDLVHVEENGSVCKIHLPKAFSGRDWEPKRVYPLEVIDGQHRLWAFEDFDSDENFELPVVAFSGLPAGWQAYLFWSVNITPKRINRSLAFDLYPLLRQQSWLEKFTGHKTYRETRCQELVEALWANPESPWYQRINMLGETKDQREYKGPSVTQAAWVRSLFTTMVKHWEGTGKRIGGLFGAPPNAHDPAIPWDRAMQAAFLIWAGNALKREVAQSNAEWAIHLREAKGRELFKGDDAAFYGEYSLISTDQGIRGWLFVINDLCFIQSKELKLMDWYVDRSAKHKAPATEEVAVSVALKSFSKTTAAEFLESIAKGMASYDWRTSSTPKLAENIRLRQLVFRGSSGYREMRRQLLDHLSKLGGQVGKTAKAAKHFLRL